MISPIHSSNPVVRSILEGTVPRPAMVAAARGILPLPQNDMLEVLVALTNGTDSELANFARETLGGQDASALKESVASDDVAESVLGYFAAQPAATREVQQAILSNARTPSSSILQIARGTNHGELLEQLTYNQQLLIQSPEIVEAILANPNRSSEAERRATELKREFFEKERGAQQIASELRAQGKEAAAQFVEHSDIDEKAFTAEEALFLSRFIEVEDEETDDSWLGLEFIEEIYEETSEQRQMIADKIIGELRSEDSGSLPNERISVINLILKMGIKDRARLAMKGDREARNILIRDPNRIVAQAVVGNPRITEQEIEKIAAMRSITEDVLRGIANNRQWARTYAIIHNLARNPRTPIANVMNFLPRLQMRDLAALSGNRNVSDAVRRQALRLSHSRKGG